MDWIIGLQKAIDYIENNLTDTIDYEKVAAQSYSSSYHFQRVFSNVYYPAGAEFLTFVYFFFLIIKCL